MPRIATLSVLALLAVVLSGCVSIESQSAFQRLPGLQFHAYTGPLLNAHQVPSGQRESHLWAPYISGKIGQREIDRL